MRNPTVTDGVVTWFCDLCRRPIEDRDGYLGVDVNEAIRIQQLWEVHRAQHPKGSTLSEMPEETETLWYSFHTDCSPSPEPAGEYSIEVGEVRTLAKVLHWTGHLIEKPWILTTNWSGVIRAIASRA